MISNQSDPYAKEKAMSFPCFVNSLFDPFRDTKKQGLYIQREDGCFTRVDIIPIDNKIKIHMDDVDMGYFEEMTERG